jgi:hypothetical protein
MNSDKEIMRATNVAVPPSTSHTLEWNADAKAQVPGTGKGVHCCHMPSVGGCTP